MADGSLLAAHLDVDRLFSAVRLGPLALPNRLAAAPMTRVSATADGRATPAMRDYYRSFAVGGFGLIFSEGIYTDKAFSQGYLHQPGLTDAAQQAAWEAVVSEVHRAGGRMIAQLMHAGALSQGNPRRGHSAGPSVVRPKGAQMTFYRGDGPYRLPEAMTFEEITEAVAGFAAAARRARAAGFDGVEIHAANGYLLDQFLTSGVNRRTDVYGGDVAARLKLTIDVLTAVRHAVGQDFTVGARLSQAKVNDFDHRWNGDDEARAIFSAIGAAGADYIHTTEYEAWRSAFEGGSTSLAALALSASGLPVVANGGLHSPDRAAEQIQQGMAVTSIGRGALANADWPSLVRSGRAPAPFDPALLHPVADLENARRMLGQV